jgi:hypothetical protein
MNINDRRSTIDVTVMLIVVSVAVTLQRIFPDVDNSLLFVAVSVLTARGVYELLIQGIYWSIRSSGWLLRLYWGKLYVAGIWSYTYELAGRHYCGVWRIEQDEWSTRVVGFGLEAAADLTHRTMVRSVSPLIDEQGAYFILNDRIEFDPGPAVTMPIDAATASDPRFNASEPTYSKTTLVFDGPRAPRSMRAITYIFGGPSSGQVHTDVRFRKLEGCESLQAGIETLEADMAERRVIRRIDPGEGDPQARSA